MGAALSITDRLAARNPQTALSRARALQAAQKYERALALFVIAAEAGLADAQAEVGGKYLRGESVMRNAVEAARWFSRAAEQGHVTAQRDLAGLFLYGLQPAELTNEALFSAPSLPVDAAPEADFATALHWALLAARAGDTPGQVICGFIYAVGPAALRDADRAKLWYEKAAAADSPQGHLGLGITMLHSAETDAATFAAIAHIRAAAAGGLGTAHYYLALIYEKAIGVHADLALAAKHYEIAAGAKIRNAMAKHGFMLFEGIGQKANRVEGESWLRRAGLAGDLEAAAIVADIYARGGELPPNYAEAAAWFRLSAEAGHRESARALGMLYLTGAGVPRDPDEAAVWFRRAAEAGDPAAKADLASLLLSGRTNPRITAPAPVHEWFEQAAQQGDLVGAYNYAVCLAQGMGVPRDDARAAHWFRRAADGVLNAQYQYGRILAAGRGVPADPEEARIWLQKSADMGLADALFDLAGMHLDGKGGPRDHATACRLYEQAAQKSHPGAMFALGAMYGGGHDIPADRALALRWFRAGAAHGQPLAALMLGKYLALGIATPVDPAQARHWLTVARDAGIAEAATELAALEADGSQAAE